MPKSDTFRCVPERHYAIRDAGRFNIKPHMPAKARGVKLAKHALYVPLFP